MLDKNIKGLRLRKGNILVGDKTTLNSIFKKPRFNGWFQGEIFIFDTYIVPKFGLLSRGSTNLMYDDFRVSVESSYAMTSPTHKR